MKSPARQSERIERNPDICGGAPVIRGTRVMVENIVAMLSAGVTAQAILEDFPYLTAADIEAARDFAGA